MALVQLNQFVALSWKGGQATYNFPANTIVNVPEDVGEYIKNSPYYSAKLVFYEAGVGGEKKTEVITPDETLAKKNLESFLEEIKEDNKDSLKNSLIPANEKEVNGLSQLMEETLPSKEVKKPRTPKKINKKIS